MDRYKLLSIFVAGLGVLAGFAIGIYLSLTVLPQETLAIQYQGSIQMVQMPRDEWLLGLTVAGCSALGGTVSLGSLVLIESRLRASSEGGDNG